MPTLIARSVIMIADRRRPFAIDLVVLGVATALGLAGSVFTWESWGIGTLVHTVANPNDGRDRPGSMFAWYIYITLLRFLPLVATWTVTRSLLALRSPRSPIARLADSPGVAACWTATLVMAISWTMTLWKDRLTRNYGWEILLKPWHDGFGDPSLCDIFYHLNHDSSRSAGIAVATVWVLGAIGGRWRVGPGRIDRAGIGLGIAWIAIVLAEAVGRPTSY